MKIKKGKHKSDIIYHGCVEPLLENIGRLIAKGHTEKEVYSRYGISPSSWIRFKHKHPGLLVVLKRAHRIADARVERSLFDLATGAKSKTDHWMRTKKGKIHTESIKTKNPPNYQAIVFWLKNRFPEKWTDAQRIDHNINSIADLVKSVAGQQKGKK